MNPAENLAAYMQGSQAVDETGAPKRLYHATSADFSVFDPKKAAKNSGHPASRLGHFLAATPEAADLFSRKPDKFSQGTGEYKPGANIMPVHAAIKNPHVMSWKEFAGALAFLNSMPDKKANKEVDAFRQQLIDAGHDGILIKGGWKPGQFLGSPEFLSDNWVAFDPTQIKSATGNQGTFDPSNPDITKRDGGDVEGSGPSIDMSVDKQNNRLSAKAIDDWNKAIGHATFNIGDNNELDPQHVEVHENHRKSGIAKKLYDHVARNGYKIIRSNDQTDAGHAFWNKHQGSNKVWQVKKADGGALTDDEGITAYHGSPHDFEQFDISKIGTGEGAQVYGHGLYFAENENTAKSYRDALSDDKLPRIDGSEVQRNDPRYMANSWTKALFGDRKQAAEALERAKKNAGAYGATEQQMDEAISLLLSNSELPKYEAPGHMYEVHINAHPDHFLDWDTPLNQQSDHVQNAVRQSLEYAKKKATTPEQRFSWSSVFKRPDEFLDYTGSSIQNLLGRNLGLQDASDALAKHGIKGIKYFDQSSRQSGEGSRNYVVFDHNHVAVKRKYARGGMVDEAA